MGFKKRERKKKEEREYRVSEILEEVFEVSHSLLTSPKHSVLKLTDGINTVPEHPWGSLHGTHGNIWNICEIRDGLYNISCIYVKWWS